MDIVDTRSSLDDGRAFSLSVHQQIIARKKSFNRKLQNILEYNYKFDMKSSL